MKRLFTQIKEIALNIYVYITTSFKEETSWYNPPPTQQGNESVRELFSIYSNPKYIAFRTASLQLRREAPERFNPYYTKKLITHVCRRQNENRPIRPDFVGVLTPTPNVLGESTGYDMHLVSETTAILPPRFSKKPEYLEEAHYKYRQAVFERTYLRCERLLLIEKENPEDLEAQVYRLVEGYYKVDAFEKKLLFGTENACNHSFYEPIEVVDVLEFVSMFNGYFISWRYEHESRILCTIILEAYEALNLPETLIIGTQEGLAVEPDASSEMAEAIVNEAAQSPYGFWTYIALFGVGVAAVLLCGRSLNVAELLNDIKDL